MPEKLWMNTVFDGRTLDELFDADMVADVYVNCSVSSDNWVAWLCVSYS